MAISLASHTPAQACRAHVFTTPLLHEAVPELPPGAVAAEVEMVSDKLEARIISMISGDFRGRSLKFDLSGGFSSCDGLPAKGERGIAVGYVVSNTDEVLVIDPISAPSMYDLAQRSAGRHDDASKP